MRTILCISLLLGLAAWSRGQETLIHRSMALNDRYQVTWTADLDRGNVTFDITARTLGFIGFGLSPQGGMSQADVIIGGVDASGTPYFTDRFAEGKREPTIDDSQDWTLLAASENATHTFLRVTRALDTCDEKQDLPINNDTTKFIWSFGETDDIQYHSGNRGQSSVNILDPLLTVVDPSKFDVFHVDVSTALPNVDTAYWCTAHKSPKLARDRQIVGFRVKNDNELALAHNHHMILHKCTTNDDPAIEAALESFIGQPGGPCYGSISGFKASEERAINSVMGYCNTYLYVWAKGGDALFLPENVGLPLNENGKQEYYLLEIHYDNPNLAQNLHYDTGIEIFTTTALREHEAAVLTVGHSINAGTLVPPNATNFVNVGHCSDSCTKQKFPAQGINVFNVLLHAHLAAKALKLRHFRDGKELPFVSYDNNYDFNYQQNRPLVNEAKILPGDQLTYECTYDSTYRDPPSVTIGGLTTRDEMCETFLLYWPKMKTLDRCGSTYPLNKLMPKFGIEAWGSGRDPTISKPASMAGKKYSTVLNTMVDWNEPFTTDLQKALRYEVHNEVCSTASAGKRVLGEARVITYPGDLEEYVPPESTCTKP